MRSNVEMVANMCLGVKLQNQAIFKLQAFCNGSGNKLFGLLNFWGLAMGYSRWILLSRVDHCYNPSFVRRQFFLTNAMVMRVGALEM